MVSVSSAKIARIETGRLDVEQWLGSVAGGRSDSELMILRRAAFVAEDPSLAGETAFGQSLGEHAIAVANILATLNLDYETLAAALVHDAVEHGKLTLSEIEAQFGEGIAKLVDGVLKMNVIDFLVVDRGTQAREKANTETLRKMLLAMVEDVRVVLIKLADRLHLMRSIKHLPDDERQVIAQETVDLFAPLANRLGIWQIKWELEDLAFRYLDGETYKKIARLLNEKRVDREAYIANFTRLLEEALRQAGIEATVVGRPKHIFSIYRKMRQKEKDYSQIYDVRAARVIVKEVQQCYAALGVVHALWQYIPGEFDDYITAPKSNDYRSLHTAVIGPAGKTVEVQIRTQEMHQHSEFGVAAHWRYKEGGGPDAGFAKRIAWLRQVLEWKDEVRTGKDFLDKLRVDAWEDRVYVFTPSNDVIDLPKGATPLDFAYAIHTELGHRCRGAKVNGRMVPLTHTLTTGEQIEILAVKRGEPSRDWLIPHLGYLQTAKARARVQQWFKQQNFEKNVDEGRDALDRELRRLGLRDVNLTKLAKNFDVPSVDHLLAALGRNDIKLSQVVKVLEDAGSIAATVPLDLPYHAAREVAEPTSTGVHVLGVGNLLTQSAHCCNPVPGDEIAGYITRGRGVTIHRADCRNVLRFMTTSPERVIAVHWGRETQQHYRVNIDVLAYEREGILRDVTAVLTNAGINIVGLNTSASRKSQRLKVKVSIEVSDLNQLSRVLSALAQLPNVFDVRRASD